MQTSIFIAIVIIAAIYLAHRVYKDFTSKPENDCNCGCSDCSRTDKTVCTQKECE